MKLTLFKKNKHLDLGVKSEQQACEYLLKRSLTLIEKNYNTRYGEIDLVMKEGDELVFVEVRSRYKNNYADAIESITPSKQKKLRFTAEHYLNKHYQNHPPTCRFDVVAIDLTQTEFSIEWIKDAF